MNEKIELSVCVVCYNQEKYIAECLESLVSQETNFKFEIIVGEDCSTDNTRIIVQQYVDRYPHLIRPIFYRKNVGAVENIKQVYIAAKGKYIAHIDGDDLAFPAKLQKQFDILESNIDCNICTHDVKQIDSNGEFKNRGLTHPQGKYDIFHLYQNLPFFAHSSKMFRNKYDSNFWEELLNNPKILDIDIHVASLESDYIYHTNEMLGAYRVGVGISFDNKKINRDLSLGAERVFAKAFNTFKDDSYKLELIQKSYSLAMLRCAYSYAVYDKDIELFRRYVDKSLKYKNVSFEQSVFKIAALLPMIFFPLFSIRSKIKNR
ncbi:glycosyltransferase family 2 protein [Psychrobacter sp. UBA3068]|uniref:glycosyltransferase family 2 protein n=1 Tax=Psychrobacter sp. UBA3068 TaxID=1947349 RepID=UPI00257EE747|nr:glycosyltransferase family 2 protein [Psychrobacter sp. UBA3068]